MHRKIGSLLNLFVAASMLLALVAMGPSATVVAQAPAAPSGPGEVRLLTGPNQGEPLDIALAYIRDNAGKLGLSAADLDDFVVKNQYLSSHNGVTHIYLRQRYQGIEVASGDININVARNGSIINMGNSFVANLAASVNRQTPDRTASQAIQAAADYLELDMAQAPELESSKAGPAREATFSPGSIALSSIPVKLVYHVVSAGVLRLAWNLEIEELSGQHYWSMNVDAETDEILGQMDYVAHDNWGPAYETDDGLAGGFGVAGINATTNPAPDAAQAAPYHGIYRVFDIPKESPLDGPRALVAPDDPLASPFGWHDTDGLVGAEYSITRGNNAYAYADTDANNSPDPGSAPDGGPTLVFDFPLDLNLQPNTYQPAAITNLFYWNNIIHDVFYQYGFDEVAGNFQQNNYGRGGLGADYVRAEGQDGAGTNNANFGTPIDGFRPRMQMFLWEDPVMTLTVTAPPAIAMDYEAVAAGFGLQSYDVTAETEIADPIDGCTPIVNNVTGKIAIIDRGACNFIVKAQNAEAAGAIGAIVVTYPGLAPSGMGCTSGCTSNIPSAMISWDDGEIFKNSIPLPTVRMLKAPRPTRDGDFDNGVITHEYGHGLSNRLVGGPANVGCLQNAEQPGEGWSDFVGLILTDKGTSTTRALANYDLYLPADGPGLRPTPYSLDMGINPTTYADIAGLVIPHGVGYAFNSMLWEVYWNLINKYGYNPDIYGDWTTGGNNLTMQLVVDGMKLAPCNPGFVDARNAILAADIALTGGDNYCDIWEGFAKRGLGYSADQGSSLDTTDGTEAFDLPPACLPPEAEISPVGLLSTQLSGRIANKTLSIENSNSSSSPNSQVTTTETVNQDAGDSTTTTATVLQDNPNDPSTASYVTTITIADTMFLHISTTNETTPGSDVDLYVYDSLNNLVGVSASGGSDEYVLLVLPPDDDYTIALHGWFVPGGTTDIDLTVETMPTPGIGPVSYFSTDVAVLDTVLLEISTSNSGNPSDIDLYVLDPGGSLAGYSAGPTDVESVSVVLPQNGDYTVVVTGPDVPGGSDTFDLTVKTISGLGNKLTWAVTEAPVNCAAPADIPWVSASPLAGEEAPGLHTNITVEFDATGLAVGDYFGKLCVATNDPLQPMIEVPLTLEVLFPVYVPFTQKN